jgi:hypothetical protein
MILRINIWLFLLLQHLTQVKKSSIINLQIQYYNCRCFFDTQIISEWNN